MRERPILFSAPMVRAILAGQKTQTRRTKGLEYFSQPENDPDGWRCARVRDGTAHMVYKQTPHEREVKCPLGQPGDRLWVRETWKECGLTARGIPVNDGRDGKRAFYAADGHKYVDPNTGRPSPWKPSIHMPRWASRITLEITSVRVERLNEISEADCWAEGIAEVDGMLEDAAICDLAKRMGRSLEDAAPTFAALWESINGAGAWDANPWVWVVEFQ